jgi:hypothetical protein
LHLRSHFVIQLSEHLVNEHTVIFVESLESDALESNNIKAPKLVALFTLNDINSVLQQYLSLKFLCTTIGSNIKGFKQKKVN